MLDFLKHLFNNQHRNINFLLIDDSGPESSTSFRFKPVRLIRLLILAVAGAVFITLLMVMFTPLGGMLYSQEDQALRKQAIEISGQVHALQDSLKARDNQMREMKQVLSAGIDTTFSVNYSDADLLTQENGNLSEPETFSEVSSNGMLSANEIIFSSNYEKVPEFPADYPIEGTFTRGYNPDNDHYGVDIATEEGNSFKAIADGAIINQDWTLNYGYVLHVQHGDGVIVVYKHARTLNKSIGDVVLKGDILGTVGDVGILSSGPHLHIEIWKDGIPQNPNMYLIKS